MAKAKQTAAKKLVVASTTDNPVESNKPAPDLASVPPSEPPQSKLHAKVLAHMDSIRSATTTELHALACECIEHAATFRDLRPLLAFQNAMPKSLRKVAFAAWVQAMGPVDWAKRDKDDNCTGIKLAVQGSKNDKDWNIEGARKVSFFDVQEAVKPKGINDTLKMLMAKRKGYEEMIADKDILRKDGVTDEALIAEIAKLTTAIKAVA